MDTRQKRLLLLFIAGSGLFYALIGGYYDGFAGSREFIIPAAVVFLSGLAACMMSLYASRLEPLKAFPWVTGSMGVELFIPMAAVIWLKIDDSLLVKPEELVIILKYLLILFFFNLIFEKALTLSAFQKTKEKRTETTTDEKPSDTAK